MVEPWIDGLWEPLESILSSSSSGNSTVADVDYEPSPQLHDSCSSMNTIVTRDNQTMGEKSVVDGSVDIETANNIVAVENSQIIEKTAVDSSGGPRGVVETEGTMDATCVQELQCEPSTRQAQPSVLDSSVPVQRTLNVISELATSFKDQLQVSQSSTGGHSTSAEHSNLNRALATRENMSASSSLDGGESRPAQVSGIEIHAAAVSETIIDGVAGRRDDIKEDTLVRDEFRSPSVELASIPLILPSVQPPFIQVLLTTVSVYMYIIHTCA